jgi:hypothetical protein
MFEPDAEDFPAGSGEEPEGTYSLKEHELQTLTQVLPPTQRPSLNGEPAGTRNWGLTGLLYVAGRPAQPPSIDGSAAEDPRLWCCGFRWGEGEAFQGGIVLPAPRPVSQFISAATGLLAALNEVEYAVAGWDQLVVVTDSEQLAASCVAPLTPSHPFQPYK